MSEGIGNIFLQETKYYRDRMTGQRMQPTARPDMYKRYPDAQIVELPPAVSHGGAPLWDAVAKRRSVRHYTDQPITRAELSQLLWACQGLTGTRSGHAVRSAPSAGALYPIETYVVVNLSPGEDLAPGLYHYEVEAHRLNVLRSADLRRQAAAAALDQPMVAEASVVFIWTAVFERARWKYAERAYRYVCLDAGHVAAHVLLAAVAIGLASCQIAALYDDEVNALVGADGESESVLYMTSVGQPARR